MGRETDIKQAEFFAIKVGEDEAPEQQQQSPVTNEVSKEGIGHNIKEHNNQHTTLSNQNTLPHA